MSPRGTYGALPVVVGCAGRLQQLCEQLGLTALVPRQHPLHLIAVEENTVPDPTQALRAGLRDRAQKTLRSQYM